MAGSQASNASARRAGQRGSQGTGCKPPDVGTSSRQRAAILDHISSEGLLFTGSESHPFSLLYIQHVFIEHFLCGNAGDAAMTQMSLPAWRLHSVITKGLATPIESTAHGEGSAEL